MEELETLDGDTDCAECPGPPPEFRLPPPPRPPFLTEGTFCSEAPLAELEDCVAIPMIDASYHTNPSLQSTALIITCAVVLLLMAAIISVVFWKHKRKVQNLLPCKSAASGPGSSSRGRVIPEGQTHSSGVGPGVVGGSVLYEDLSEAVGHSQHTQMLDMKDADGRSVFVCSSPGPDAYNSQDSFNPVYEELSNGDRQDTDEENEPKARCSQRSTSNRRRRRSISAPESEDEFAEDELSLGEPADVKMLASGIAGWGTCPAITRQTPRGRKGRSSGSLDRRRRNVYARDLGEFHEGMLLDALLQLCPNVAGVAESGNSNGRQRSVPSVAHRLPYIVQPLPPTPAPAPESSVMPEENPYECVPVLGPLHRYSTQSRNPKDNRFDYSRYGSEYYELPNQDLQDRRTVAPAYAEVTGDYSEAYSQPSDRLFSDDKYAQPIYYTARDPDHLSTAGRLYQGLPDSSFGSDSGYSHHTSGTTGTSGTRGSNSRVNHRKDKQHRNSQHSHNSFDYAVS